MLKSEPRNSLASNSFRFSIGSRRKSRPSCYCDSGKPPWLGLDPGVCLISDPLKVTRQSRHAEDPVGGFAVTSRAFIPQVRIGELRIDEFRKRQAMMNDD